MFTIHSSVSILLLAILLLSSPLDATESAEVTLIEGGKVRGELISWSADRLDITSESLQRILLNDVRAIAFERPSQSANRLSSWVLLSNGDRISVSPVKVSADELSVSWPLFGAVHPPVIRLEKVAAIIFDMPIALSDQLRLYADIDTLPAGSDVVMLANGDRSLGEFEKLDASFVELKAAKSSLKLDRSRVSAIRLNPELTNATKTTGRRSILRLVDGSQITVTGIEQTNDQLTLKSPSLGKVVIPLGSVVSCQFYGDRVIPITEYQPSKVEFTPYLSATWPLVRNRNVLHGPLLLRGSEYATGLGMHSRTQVSYELRGNEREFRSIVGIDDAANGSGSAIFAVEVDGSRVWTSTDLTGKSAPLNITEISLKGRKELKLIVDFGQFADSSDYADWCDAILILNQTTKPVSDK